MAEPVVWIDGALVPMAEAVVPLLALSLQRGTLVFDVYAVEHVGGRPHGFGAREHTERFLRSAALLDYPIRYGVDDLLRAAGAAVEANPGCDAVRLNVYWAAPALDLLPTTDEPTVAVAAYTTADFGMAARPARPARLHVAGLRKVPGDVLAVQAKVAAAYAPAALAKGRARAAGYDDVLYLDADGHLAEGGTMSCFLVIDGELHVPGLESVLDGITRRTVLDIATDEGVAITVGAVPVEVLAQTEEAFLTSTIRTIWSVGLLTERELRAPGPVTARLAERLDAVLRGEDRLSTRWLQPL